MKAARYAGEPHLQLIEQELRPLQPDEVLLRVSVCSICGTDQKIVQGKSHSSPPVVTGHEFCGTVQEVGSEVCSVTTGDYVSVDPNISCGTCQFCRGGKVNLCENLRALGVDIDGGFAEYCIVPSGQCYSIRNDIPPESAALAEPLSCALYGIQKAGIRPGDSVAVIGGGLIGYLMVQLASISGAAPVLISEPIESRRNICLTVGADIGIDPRADRFSAMVREDTEGGADVVIECVGSTATVNEGIEIVKPGGTLVIFGVTPHNETVPVVPYDLYKRDIAVTGSFLNPFTFQDAVRLIGSSRINFDSLTVDKYPLDNINDALESQQAGDRMKTMIDLRQ